MPILFFILALFAFVAKSEASSYSQCKLLGVVEDVYFNKIHYRVLKHENFVENNLDHNFQQCSELKDTVVALYDDPKDAADEPCSLQVKTGYEDKKFRRKLRDNFQKGDMIKFDYTYYTAMGLNDFVCMKDWRLIEHVPLKPHSR